MPQYRFETVDVFTDQRFGGNPLAVVLDARGVSDWDMQRLAAEFNLSETTFVLPPEQRENTARVRIFNRRHEMPFAGHPLIGTAFVLARLMEGSVRTMRFELPAGIVEVLPLETDGAVSGASLDAPQPLTLGTELSAGAIARCVGLSATDVRVAEHPPIQASVGNTYVIAEVSPPALDRATPDLAAFPGVLRSYPLLHGRFSLYLYARRANAIAACMFAPLVGTHEDAATGSAATPLAALLLSLSGRERERFMIEQGTQMGRPSLLHAAAYRAADGIRASVAGSCVPVLWGEARL